MRLKTRTFFTMLPMMAIPFVPMSAPVARAIDGFVVSMNITDDKGQTVSMTYKLAADKMRLEGADIMAAMNGRGGEGPPPQMAQMFSNAFALLAGGKMTVVMQSMNMGISMDLAGAAGRAGVQAQAQGTVEDLGAGESIAGRATHRYRFKATNGETTEVWLATDLAGLDFKAFSQSFAMQMGGSGNVLSKINPGFPMRIVVAGKTTPAMEVTKIEKASFPESTFEVPPGVQVMDGAAMMGGRGRGRGGN